MSEQISAEVAKGLVDAAQGADEVHVTDGAPEQELNTKPQTEQKDETKKPEDNRFAAKFAALSRKEKEIKQREKQLEERIKQLEAQAAQKSEPEQVQKEVEPLEYRIKKDPFGTLKEYGLDLDTLVNIALNDGKPTQDIQLQLLRQEIEGKTQKELSEIRAKLEAKEKAEEEARQRAEEERNQQVVEGFVEQIVSFVDSRPDDYELIRTEEAHDLVFDVIKEHFENTKDETTGVGEVLDFKAAADEVENYLLEEAKKRLELKKIKGLVAPQAAKVEPSKNSPASVTLSNSQAQVQSATSGKSQLSRDESLQEAAKLLRWRE